LKNCISQYDLWEIYYAKGVEEGLKQCLSWKKSEDVVFIVGSLYLVGLVKAVLGRENHD
jgi:folylpolyglutamate synthase/dihydropteroate synthase